MYQNQFKQKAGVVLELEPVKKQNQQQISVHKETLDPNSLMGKFQEQIILIFFQTLPDNKNVALFNSFKNASIIKPGQCRNVSLQEKKGNLQASLNHEY